MSETYAERRIREAEERGDCAKANLYRRIKARVDEAPELTPEQIAQLRILLAPAAPVAPAA
jgi:hypothetical protein